MPLSNSVRREQGQAESPSAAENHKYRTLATTRHTFTGPLFVDDGINTTRIGEAVDVAAAPRPSYDPVSRRWVREGAISDHQQFINWYIGDKPMPHGGKPPGASAAHGFPGMAPVMQMATEIELGTARMPVSAHGFSRGAIEGRRDAPRITSRTGGATGRSAAARGIRGRGSRSSSGSGSALPALPPLPGATATPAGDVSASSGGSLGMRATGHRASVGSRPQR
eukprot:TRINITY_DN8190_c0_g1_i1.p1 TRINITY_DN8190_c0_g1~~TRINITY_DN8190_c0_g1_i1.p1  ORF type:complete len:224 (+),score=38.45 TRINITY_DN8190_c0_g1_i1:105-776(+)